MGYHMLTISVQLDYWWACGVPHSVKTTAHLTLERRHRILFFSGWLWWSWAIIEDTRRCHPIISAHLALTFLTYVRQLTKSLLSILWVASSRWHWSPGRASRLVFKLFLEHVQVFLYVWLKKVFYLFFSYLTLFDVLILYRELALHLLIL